MQLSRKQQSAAVVAALTFFTLTVYAVTRGPGTPARHAVHTPPASPSALSVTTSTVSDVTLEARLDRGALLRGSDGELHVALALRAGTPPGLPPVQPTDALVVLDVSGSMMGQKLDYAKQALHQLIDRLSPQDRFALVTYDSEARLVTPLGTVADKTRLHRTVDGLQVLGGTNMSAGLELALDQLSRRERAGRTARVLLLSDGHANEGDSSEAGLISRARKVVAQDDVLSAIGIGDDFNEDLMTALAERGAGNFYYLSQVGMLGRYFDAELRAASQTVASALELEFEPAPGVQLTELGGYPVERVGERYVVRPGNLVAGQERVLWATLRAPTATLGEVALGQFGVRFKAGQAPQHARTPELPRLACVGDGARFEAAIVRPVWEDYVTTEQYQKAQANLGRAVGEGSEADIVREQQAFEANRALASKLGSQRVLDQLAAMASKAESAKVAQKASPGERKYNAKQMKSRALFDRRKDAYNDDPSLSL
jgi:Ca-activated chloride channel homolog